MLLQALVVGPLMVVSVINSSKHQKTYGVHDQTFGEFVESISLLKVWLVFLCATILPYFIYQVMVGSIETMTGLFILFVCLFVGVGLPVEFFSDYEKYRNAANKNNT
jgi:high-affinity Fe2+/Pb2+ permease